MAVSAEPEKFQEMNITSDRLTTFLDLVFNQFKKNSNYVLLMNLSTLLKIIFIY